MMLQYIASCDIYIYMSLLYIIQKGDLVSVAKVESIKNVRFDLRYKACNWWIVGEHLDLYIIH